METRYSVSEIECLAAVESIKHFLVYLDGRRFTLQTDHRALEHLLSAKLTKKKPYEMGSAVSRAGVCCVVQI